MKDTTNKKPKKCRLCPQIPIQTEEEYLLHIENEHKGNINYYMCSDCAKQFKTRSELTQHIKSKCGTVKLFKCNVCNQELMTSGSLHNHMLRHKGERSFMCRFCAKLFLTAGQLKVHERIHTQEKAFVCEVCNKGFCHRQSLITHSTIHTGVKPFQCENCGNSFSCVGNLIKHHKTHADTCGLIPLTTHRVQHPATKIKVRINTPANSKLKTQKRSQELLKRLTELKTQYETSQEDQKEGNEEIAISKEVRMNNSTNLDINGLEKNDISADAIENLKTEVENIFNNRLENVLDESHSALLVDQNIQDEINCEELDNTYETDNSEEREDLKVNSSHSQEETDRSYLESSRIENKRRKKKRRKKSGKKLMSELEEFVKERCLENPENLRCQYCGKKYSIVLCLFKHERRHMSNAVKDTEKKTNVPPFKCSCCKMNFTSKDECKNHQETVHVDILTCHECDKIFKNPDSLRAHKKIFHKGAIRKIYTYICEKCGKQFKQKSNLVIHETQDCKSGPFHECPICKKQFSTVHTRNNHLRVHEPEKKLLCKFCGKSFHWKGQLKVHERSHTGEKPFTCLFCPKAFAYRESLITHSSIHTGIKPHLCEGCGSRFSCIGNLIKHKSTHASTCGSWTYRK